MIISNARNEPYILKTWRIIKLRFGDYIIWRNLDEIKDMLGDGWSLRLSDLNQITDHVGNVRKYQSLDEAIFYLEYIGADEVFVDRMDIYGRLQPVSYE